MVELAEPGVRGNGDEETGKHVEGCCVFRRGKCRDVDIIAYIPSAEKWGAAWAMSGLSRADMGKTDAISQWLCPFPCCGVRMRNGMASLPCFPPPLLSSSFFLGSAPAKRRGRPPKSAAGAAAAAPMPATGSSGLPIAGKMAALMGAAATGPAAAGVGSPAASAGEDDGGEETLGEGEERERECPRFDEAGRAAGITVITLWGRRTASRKRGIRAYPGSIHAIPPPDQQVPPLAGVLSLPSYPVSFNRDVLPALAAAILSFF